MDFIPVYADTETCSECDLKKHGTHRYAEHPTTRIQLFSYAIGDSPVKLWSLEDGEPMPDDLKQTIDDPRYIFWFHNAWFDRNVIEHCLGIYLPIHRYRCAMALALSHALPAGLEKLGEVLGLPQNMQKIKDGKRLVQKFCKPRKQKDGSLKWATPQTDPDDWKRYKEYCSVDTAAMKECIRRIPKWNYTGVELEYWFMDQTVNSRGMNIDIEFVLKAMDVIALNQKRLSSRTNELTNGEVQAASQRDAMLKYLLEQFDIELPDMRKATLQRLLDEGQLPPEVVELIELRLDTCTTSTAKYKKIVDVTSADGRVRGTIQFAGASRTLRDAGRSIQPQNAPRPTLSHYTITESISVVRDLEPAHSGEVLDLLGINPMELCSSAIRYTITAAEGHKFVVADLSNIEGRVVAYLANEEWKLDAFRKYDDGKGPDIYIASYANSFKVPIEKVTKADRQVGKVLELALSYSGGPGAFISFATIYGINLEELALKVIPTLDPAMLNKARELYDWIYQQPVKEGAKPCFGLGRDTFAAIDCIKRLWREAHPNVTKLWEDTENAMRNAVAVEKQKFYFGNGIYAVRNKSWVLIVLPSKHVLCYPQMEIHNGKLRFKGIDQFTKKWDWIYTFGGKGVENMTQAFARDIFKHGQLLAENNGYKIVMPVHDELVAEVPDTDDYTVEGLEHYMATVPEWAKGLPLSAEGFSDYRYHK